MKATDNDPESAAALKTDIDCIVEAKAKHDYPRDEEPAPPPNTPDNATEELLHKSSGKAANNSLRINMDPLKPKADEQSDSSGTNTPNTTQPEDDNSGKGQLEATFPQQLMDVIEQETKDGTMVDGERVFEWLPNGDGFVIRDKAILEKDVLPRYFSAKCKFMSFVRKLYRWGFHQKVEPNSQTRAMIFMHSHFVRGDKKRCLKMRSIVKKPAAQRTQAQDYSGMLDANSCGPFSSNMLPPFGSNNPYSMGHPYNMNPMLFPQQARQVMPYAGAPNQGGNGIMHSNSTGMGGPSSLFMPGQFPQGMTSTDMFEAGLCLERMERQQERQMQMMNMLNQDDNFPTETAASSFNPSMPPSASSFNPPMPPPASSFNPSLPRTTMPTEFDSNIHGNSDIRSDNMTEVELASQLLKGDPGMEPRRALELAKRFKQ